MPDVSLLVVGGGPAALAAVRAYRAAGGAGTVLLVTDDDRPPYRRPPLSKELLRGEIGPDELPLTEPGWFAGAGVEVRCGRAATALDPEARRVTLDDGEAVGFRACLLATGSEPVRPPLPGATLPGVHVLRTARDALALRADAPPGARVLVVGSGFVGCEAAASLAMRGARVTMVSDEPAPQATRLGDEVGARIAGWLGDLGVAVRGGRPVEEVSSTAGGLRVRAGDDAWEADAVLLATGARPRVALADDAGLAVAEGAVVTDAAMRTAHEAIWCAGDAALAANPAAGRRLRVEHWGEALAQGEVAGRTIAGRAAAWDAVPGFWSTIGRRTLKQAAWGDGWDDVEVRDHGEGAFTAWLTRRGRVVGVLAHERDDDYERGRGLVARGARLPPPG